VFFGSADSTGMGGRGFLTCHPPWWRSRHDVRWERDVKNPTLKNQGWGTRLPQQEHQDECESDTGRGDSTSK
jgi:hypothetical protein